MSDVTMTEAMREKASKKPNFNILYIGDGDSRLMPLRGENMLRTFTEYYSKLANITYLTAPSSKLAEMTVNDLNSVNVIWLDNIRDFNAIRNLQVLQEGVMESIDAGWKAKVAEMEEADRIEYITELIARRQQKVRVLYAIDEFVWEAPIGRACDVQTVQLIESAMTLSDTIITPNVDLIEAMMVCEFLSKDAETMAIPTAGNSSFFPLHKNFLRKGSAQVSALRDKPNVLIKGMAIPDNVQDFICDNYGNMNITICSIGEVNVHVNGLLARNKVNHSMHWASPVVNQRNLLDTYAMERDAGYDVVIHTKPKELSGAMYELTTGDEDILSTILSGAVPICGTKGIGYGDDHLSNSSGITFDAQATSKEIKRSIESLTAIPVKFNEVYNKCRSGVQARIANAPGIMGRYYNAMMGRAESEARKVIAAEINAKEEAETTVAAAPVSDRVAATEFTKGN
jgi:hypothetical protein